MLLNLKIFKLSRKIKLHRWWIFLFLLELSWKILIYLTSTIPKISYQILINTLKFKIIPIFKIPQFFHRNSKSAYFLTLNFSNPLKSQFCFTETHKKLHSFKILSQNFPFKIFLHFVNLLLLASRSNTAYVYFWTFLDQKFSNQKIRNGKILVLRKFFRPEGSLE